MRAVPPKRTAESKTMKSLRYWVQHELAKYDGQPLEDHANGAEYAKEEALKVLEAMPDNAFLYQPPTRNSHFTALNSLPVEPGTRWMISEDVYDEMCDCLPPISRMPGGFFISEASTSCEAGNIRSAYFKEGGKYWHQYEVTQF